MSTECAHITRKFCVCQNADTQAFELFISSVCVQVFEHLIKKQVPDHYCIITLYVRAYI